MSKDRLHIPKASTLMSSLRSMGYTFESAVADVIDNSISAYARNVHILFPSNPLDKLAIGILDDGIGMTSEELLEAMRYGSSSAEDTRAEDDLGRFGMGLKSASLSQCAKLTVVSYNNGCLNANTWDFKHILEREDWLLQELDDTEIQELPYIDRLKKQDEGTLVIWEDFDVISKSSGGQVYQTLMDLRVPLESHVALIFHRFLSSVGTSRLRIFLNEVEIQPLDPFLEQHPKTTRKKEITLDIKDSDGIERHIHIRPFVLPFATDLKEEDKRLVGGIENLRSKQGFYVYRNKRLIIWGTWFGMKQRAELTKNARVRVDIPNTLDDVWSIDIKKERATIPKHILRRLRTAVEDALDFSVRQQTYRGRTKKVNEDFDYIWDRKEGRGGTFFYQINRDSQFFRFIREKLSDEDYNYVDLLLTEIEKNIPIQQMYIDKSNEAIAPLDNTENRLDEVFQTAVTMISAAKKIRNDSLKEIIVNLMNWEPFCHYPTLKDKLLQNYSIND